MVALREFLGHCATETMDRQGGMPEDPWKIYEISQSEKNLLAITVALRGVSRQPACDRKSAARYRAVPRAYKKAVKMIQLVEELASKRQRLPRIIPPESIRTISCVIFPYSAAS
jgi:hypothetical protein